MWWVGGLGVHVSRQLVVWAGEESVGPKGGQEAASSEDLEAVFFLRRPGKAPIQTPP